MTNYCYPYCNRCGAEAALELRSPLCWPCYRDVLAEAKSFVNVKGGHRGMSKKKWRSRQRKLEWEQLELGDDAETVPGL